MRTYELAKTGKKKRAKPTKQNQSKSNIDKAIPCDPSFPSPGVTER